MDLALLAASRDSAGSIGYTAGDAQPLSLFKTPLKLPLHDSCVFSPLKAFPIAGKSCCEPPAARLDLQV